jgi:hypothetical protein
MKLVDFSELVAKGDQVDSELEDLCVSHKDKAEPDRKNAISL